MHGAKSHSLQARIEIVHGARLLQGAFAGSPSKVCHASLQWVSMRLQTSSKVLQVRQASLHSMDSWEDEEDTGEKIVLPKTALNINAPSFSFNPGASSWAPPSQSQPAAPAAEPASLAPSNPAAQPSHAEDAPAASAPPAAADTDMAEPDQHQAHEQQHDEDASMRDGDDSSAGEAPTNMAAWLSGCCAVQHLL